MCAFQSRTETCVDSSCENLRFAEALIRSRPREKNDAFLRLQNDLGDSCMAEVIWVIYGEGSVRLLDAPVKALNSDRRWWNFWSPKNTIRSLIKTREGKKIVWQMLHDASAWL